jgi:hypothetical protein
MHPTGSCTSTEATSDGRGKLAVVTGRTPSSERTNFDGVSLVLASLGTAKGAGFNVVPVRCVNLHVESRMARSIMTFYHPKPKPASWVAGDQRSPRHHPQKNKVRPQDVLSFYDI